MLVIGWEICHMAMESLDRLVPLKEIIGESVSFKANIRTRPCAAQIF